MAVTLHKPDGLSIRQKTIRDIIKYWLQYNKAEARACAALLRQLYKNQVNPKTGAWKETDKGYFKVAFPQELMLRCRLIFRKVLPEEPPFGHDDADILFIMKEFPDIIHGNLNTEVRKNKKDHRKKTTLWSDQCQERPSGTSSIDSPAS